MMHFHLTKKLATAVCLTVVSFAAVAAEMARPFTYAHWNVGHFAIGRSNKSTIAADKAEARLKEFRSWMNLGADWFGISEYAPNFTADGSVKTGTALFGDYDLQNIGPDGCFQWNAQFGKSSRFKVLESKTVFYKTRCQACYYLAQRVLIDGKTEAWIVQTHFDWKSWQINEAEVKGNLRFGGIYLLDGEGEDESLSAADRRGRDVMKRDVSDKDL